MNLQKMCSISRIGCPYVSAAASVCEASLSSMVLRSNDRQRFCDSDDYDDCPIFLSKILRIGEAAHENCASCS